MDEGGWFMNCRQMALMLGVAASCAGCVTETRTVPVSAETMAKMKDIKEAEHPKRDAQATTWVSVGRMYEAKAAEARDSAVERGDLAWQYVQLALVERPTHPEALAFLTQFGRQASLQGPMASESSPEPEFQRARFAPDW